MTAKSFTVELRFEGGLADRGELDGSDHELVTRAARRLLASHAHCFLHGKLRSAAISDGAGYHVRHVASRQGSHVDIWAVIFDPAALTIGSFIGTVYAAEIKQGINGACRFLRDSVRAALGTGPAHLPEFRHEPVLEARNGNHEPLVDIASEHEHLRLRLRELTVRVLQDLSRPVGRSASRLTVMMEGEPIAVLDEPAKQRWLASQITPAVSNIRVQARLAGSRI